MSVRLRAIIIEDDFLLAEALRDGLKSIGCEVHAQASNVRDGLQVVADTPCDFAVVDLHLNSEMAFPILDLLLLHSIPFLMATGAFADEIPERHANAPRLSKPYDMHELKQAIDKLRSEAYSVFPDV